MARPAMVFLAVSSAPCAVPVLERPAGTCCPTEKPAHHTMLLTSGCLSMKPSTFSTTAWRALQRGAQRTDADQQNGLGSVTGNEVWQAESIKRSPVSDQRHMGPPSSGYPGSLATSPVLRCAVLSNRPKNLVGMSCHHLLEQRRTVRRERQGWQQKPIDIAITAENPSACNVAHRARKEGRGNVSIEISTTVIPTMA